MLVVPLGVIGALLATWMRGLENDVYFQVGLLTVIGLSAKNAILIVEFANEMNQKGHDLFEATLHMPSAFTPDSDDLAGIYLRRIANGNQHRCRFRWSACGGYWRNGRDDFGHYSGYLLRAAVLCAGAPPLPAEAAPGISNKKGDMPMCRPFQLSD